MSRPELKVWKAEFRARPWRAELFKDIVVDELARRKNPVVLDIGCGKGFDDNFEMQAEIASHCGAFWGIEPDADIAPPVHFDQVQTAILEDADIPPGSVDVAYAVMVLEHIQTPGAFWSKIEAALKPGGVFLGFTMDRRHYFTWASALTEKLGLKDAILQRLHGDRGEERYENYPTTYISNSPSTVRKQIRTAGLGHAEFVSMNRVGQLDFYVPKAARPITHLLDRAEIALGLPGSVLAMRIEK